MPDPNQDQQSQDQQSQDQQSQDQQSQDQQSQAAASWRGMLGEQFQTHKGLVQYEDTPEGLAGLAKSFISGQEMIGKLTGGRKPIFMPGEQSTDEERAEFYAALGVPADGGGYKLSEVAAPEGLAWLPEYDEKIAGWALEAKLNPQQASLLKGAYLKDQAEQIAAVRQQRASEQAEEQAALAREWGKAEAGNRELAKRVVNTFIDPKNPAAVALGQAMLEDAHAARFLVAVGKGMSEDKLQGGRDSAPILRTPAEAKRRYTELQQHPAYQNKHHPEHAQILSEVEAILSDMSEASKA